MQVNKNTGGLFIKYFLMACLCSGLPALLDAQKTTGYNYVSRIMARIPDSLTFTTDAIAGYINSNFTLQKDKSNAVFLWITKNIRYNFDSIITNSITETAPEVSDRALKTRTGVCLNFAYLFHELSSKSGIKSFVIQGYTKQYGRVDFLPHMWCASYVDTAWYIFDPAWSAGYYWQGKYVNETNHNYFMRKPADMIRTHMPFDPLWQFLNFPISHEDFYRGNFKAGRNTVFFNFADSIAVWEKASELQRAVGVARRIEQCGVKNTLIAAKLRVVKGDIEFISNKTASQRYDTAVTKYNTGITQLNNFIGLRNSKSEEADTTLMKDYLIQSELSFRSALDILNATNCPDEQNKIAINHLKGEISNTIMKLNLQKAYFYGRLKNP